MRDGDRSAAHTCPHGAHTLAASLAPALSPCIAICLRAQRHEDMGLKPWTCIDEMRGSRLVTLALLSATALPVPTAVDWSSSSSSSSSDSSSSGSSAEWDAFFAATTWNSTITQFGFGHLMDAALPYSRRRIAYKVGPERFSFERLQREYGAGDASCKAAFRFHLRDLRRLFKAMHFPEQIDTGHERVPSEEAFLIVLKRLAYPATLATLAWPAGRSPYALSRCGTRMARLPRAGLHA